MLTSTPGESPRPVDSGCTSSALRRPPTGAGCCARRSIVASTSSRATLIGAQGVGRSRASSEVSTTRTPLGSSTVSRAVACSKMLIGASYAVHPGRV